MEITYKTVESIEAYFQNKSPFPHLQLTSVKKVSGGLCNYVYRLYFNDKSTRILKYFSKNVAFNEAPISQQRYFVEKSSLALLGPKVATGSLKVPELLYSDDDAFLLIIEDAGENLVTLMDLMQNTESKKVEPNTLGDIAKDIHNFSKAMSDRIKSLSMDDQVHFNNEAASEILPAFYIPLFKNNIEELDLKTELSETSKTLPSFIAQPNDDSDNKVLIFGDMWPNSFLIDVEKQLTWVVDWEMARFGNETQDLEQLMGNLWLMKQNSKKFNIAMIEQLMKSLQLEFFGDQNTDWRIKYGESGKRNFLWTVGVLIKFDHFDAYNRENMLKAISEIE